MVHGNFNVTTKRERTVLSSKNKITICEHEHLDKGSSKREIASEYKVTVYFMYIV